MLVRQRQHRRVRCPLNKYDQLMLQTRRSEELKSDQFIFIKEVIVLYEMQISVFVIIGRIRISI